MIPSTFAEWETVLLDRFLRIASNGDASPLRSFEVTAETLAGAAGIEKSSSGVAEAALRNALRADPLLWDALRVGRHRPATSNVPNCFTYLAMTLFIDTLLEGEYAGQGQFRDRLRSWLGTSRHMMQLSGVASMWRALAAWLDERVQAGDPLRRLVLPPPRTWTQIGHTRRLSFPTRGDVRFLERALLKYGRGTSDPPGLIRALEVTIQQGRPSWGMETAFAEFRTAFRAGEASRDHRFWRLVLRSSRQPLVDQRIEAVFELSFEEDNERLFMLGAPDANRMLSVAADIGTAMRSALVTASANLANAATRGILFFQQVGVARWRAQAHPPAGGTAIHLALASRHAPRAQGALISLERSGDWFLTRVPVGSTTLEDVLTRLQLSGLNREQLIDIGLSDGARVGPCWLGRPPFLPRIDAGQLQTSVTRVGGQGSGAQITIRDGTFTSTETVEGVYEVSARGASDGNDPGWSRRIKFVPEAVPHAELAGIAYEEPLVREWLATVPACLRSSAPKALAWSDEPPALADLLEALYACGSSGLSEAEVLDLAIRQIDGETNAWSVLRSIQEAGFIEARHRAKWRGRVWTLRQPALMIYQAASGTVFADGALCAALEREFREVAAGAGGQPFRRLGASRWAPPVVGATQVDAQALADRLGWQLITALEPALRPGGLETSALIGEHHLLASSWDWQRGHFVTGPVPPCDVSLTRWVHPGGRDHDIYRIKSTSHMSSHMTRTAAILMAHIVARMPLFRFDDDALIRTTSEGHLPLEFARWLRLASLSGGGELDQGGYGYSMGGISPRLIEKALPHCVTNLPCLAVARSDTDVLMAARRSRGRMRVIWVDGTLKAIP